MDSALGRHLRRHHVKITTPRRAVAATLQATGPASIKQLADRLHGQVDQASVYRTVALFERLGVIHHLVLGGRRVIELTDVFSHHHHHLTCTNCGRIQAISDDRLERSLHALVASHGFIAHSHTLEVSGLCRDCAAN